MYRPTAVEVIADEDSSKYYWLQVICRNCGLDKSLAFKKGDLVVDHACPQCGNVSLVKNTF